MTSLLLEDRIGCLEAISSLCVACKKCELHRTRTKVVPGHGPADAQIMIIAEAPGQNEDEQGIPLVGRAGQKLNEMLVKAGLKRESIYITNCLKCRPPNNRNPLPEEIESCKYFLKQQINIIEPRLIICLGTFAARFILGGEDTIGFYRGFGVITSVNPEFNSKKVMATYHPSYILRSPNQEEKVVNDLMKANEYIKERNQN